MQSKKTPPVGYGRPPEHSRFKPGQSGNRRGRAKASPATSDLLELSDRLLDEEIEIVQNGKRCRKSRRELLLTQLYNKAIAGELRACKDAVNLLLKLETERDSRRQKGPRVVVIMPQEEDAKL